MPRNGPGDERSAHDEALRTWPAWLFQVAAVALAYYGTGRLGLELAIPPGYATAIWPPSGIALGAVLLWGRAMWPGVALGSFVINVGTGFDAGTPSALAQSLGVPGAIAAGAALQAVVGGVLVRRFIGIPNDFSEVRTVAGLLALGGIAGCLVNATIGVAALYVTDRVPSANVPFSWATWWAGDVIGVFVFTPLILVWFSRPREEWRRRRIPVTIGLGVTFALTIVFVAYTASLERATFTSAFSDRTRLLAVELEKATAVYVDAVGAIEGLLDVLPSASGAEFRRFAARVYARVPGIQALEWAPRVTSAERGAFEATMRADGAVGFEIKEQRDGVLQRAPDRPVYFPIAIVEPLASNEPALGFDLASHPGRYAAMTAARDSGDVSFTERVSLVQGGVNQDGFLAFKPVYRVSEPIGSVEQRRSSLVGVVLGVFRFADLIATAFRGHDLSGVNLWLIDETAAEKRIVVFANSTQAPGAFESRERGLFGGSATIGNRFNLATGGRNWILETAPTQDFVALHRNQNAWTVLVLGLLLTSLVGAFMLVLTGRERVLRLLFDDNPQPMWVYDRQTLRFVDVNETAVAKYGYSREEFADMRITDIRPPEEVPRLLSLIPTLPHGYRSSSAWRHRLRDGRIIDAEIASHNITLSGRSATLVVASDITDRTKAQEALVESEQMARGIIGTALDAFVQMDEAGNIVQWNAQAEAMFGWPATEAVGRPLADLIIPARFRTQHREGLERFLSTGEAALLGKRFEIDGIRRDGQEIRLEISVTALRRRSGYVFNGFIRDLTERRAAEVRLSELQAELLHVSRLSDMGQYGSSLAHELNQPLAAITNYLAAARQTMESGGWVAATRVVEILAKASEQAARAGEIIRGLRKFISKGETERRPESLPDVIRDAGTLVTIGTSRGTFDLRYEFDAEIPFALIDRIQIQQVLVNLMRNAIEAMAQGERRTLIVSAAPRSDGFIEVRVADTGPGLSESVAGQLFQPFVTTKTEGMGVGLSICHSIVTAHGGMIWADSNPGGGTVFHFTLPSAARAPRAGAA